VASVANIDWPSKPGLSTAAQQAEIVRIVERAQAIGLNALIVQVRPAADALYPSALEPGPNTSRAAGRGAEPFYDPLAMWIAEAHRRGIELHAWFNPYRARHPTAKSPLAASHVANVAPEVVRTYGDYLWLDPAEPEAARRTLDVDPRRGAPLRRGRHPHRRLLLSLSVNGRTAPRSTFPTSPVGAVPAVGGHLQRADWRRANVDVLVQRINAAVHREKPWLRFGVSPFGVGRRRCARPASPASASTTSSTPTSRSGSRAAGSTTSFRSSTGPSIRPGSPTACCSTTGPPPTPRAPRLAGTLHEPHRCDGELLERGRDRQSGGLSRARAASKGTCTSAWRRSWRIAKALPIAWPASYRVPALVPAMPWLTDAPPAPPVVRALPVNGNAIMLTFEPSNAWLVAVWIRRGTAWEFRVIPGSQRELRLEGPVDGLLASAVNSGRHGKRATGGSVIGLGIDAGGSQTRWALAAGRATSSPRARCAA
jgi:hypothetical protein